MKGLIGFILILLMDIPNEVGIGIIEIDVERTNELEVFKNKRDKHPDKILSLLRKENGEIVIKEMDNENLFVPEICWLEYSQLLFRYTKIDGDWIEVITNKETDEKRWVLKTENVNIFTWETFLIEGTTAVEPLYSVEIKTEPDNGSKTIRKSSEKDCFEAIEVIGDWMKVRTSEGLECSGHPQPIKSGWIKWKVNNQLAIEYYTTC
jgi:hypothetical protein